MLKQKQELRSVLMCPKCGVMFPWDLLHNMKGERFKTRYQANHAVNKICYPCIKWQKSIGRWIQKQ